MPISVVFLTHNYPRHPDDLAGGFLAPVATALARRGASVCVIAPSDGGRGGEVVEAGGVRVSRVRYDVARRERFAYGGMQRALSSPAGVLALGRMCRALRAAAHMEVARGANVIHAHWWFPAGLAAPPGVPLVLTSHGSDAALLRRSRLIRALARPVYRRAAVVTAVSNEIAAWIEAGTGRHLEPRYVQPMPVDADRFSPSVGGGGAIVVSRLVPQKRVHLAIEAVAHLQRTRGLALPLVIVGDGPERDALERLASERTVTSHVRFVGAVAPAEVPAYLKTADVMLFSARDEGFGLVAAEALLAGVPVVACRDGGGVLDIVPERGAGRRVDPTPEAIAGAAVEMIGSPETARDLHRLRESWRQRLSADAVAGACEAWYHEALADARAA
jgi:glycosyltransferase involved in cell wall biosynthesis